jgi:hypothetical protein
VSNKAIPPPRTRRPVSRFRRALVALALGAISATAVAPAALLTSLALTVVGAAFAPTPAHAATTLVVNANQVLRPVTHVATGSLYGLANMSRVGARPSVRQVAAPPAVFSL